MNKPNKREGFVNSAAEPIENEATGTIITGYPPCEAGSDGWTDMSYSTGGNPG